MKALPTSVKVRLLAVLAVLPCCAALWGQSRSQLTDVQTLYVDTYGRQPVTSRTEYVLCSLTLVSDTGVVFIDSVQIRGRGNSSWTPDKKPYRIKLPRKRRLLGPGFANAKSWTLLANFYDKSMIRNALTYDLGKFVGMDFCPAARFVDFFLNGNYRGTYQISDQVQVHKARVNIDEETGWLLEFSNPVNNEPPLIYSHRDIIYCIKNPDDELITRTVRRDMTQWINDMEDCIFGEDFSSPDAGYLNYIDADDLVNWYVAAELTGNIDALFSIYAYKDGPDDKLHFGPLWDLDLGYGNANERNMTHHLAAFLGLYNRPFEQIARRLWEDPWFAGACASRLHELVGDGIEDFLLAKVDSLREVVRQTEQQNERLWSFRHHSLERAVTYKTYDEYVAYLKRFISEHIDYMVTTFDSLAVATSVAQPVVSGTPQRVRGTQLYDLGGRPVRDSGQRGVFIRGTRKFIR